MRIEGHIDTTVGLNDIDVSIAYTFDNPQISRTSLVYVHGWGCSQHDFEGAATHPSLAKYRRFSFDFPGHGESYAPPGDIGVDDVVDILNDATRDAGVGRSVLVGHSLGGLVALRFAQKHPSRVHGLVSVVGNKKSSDCFLTGEVEAGRETRDSLIERFRKSENPGFRRYAEGLQRVHAPTYAALAASAVESCRDDSPYQDFLSLEKPRLFIYGSEAASSIPYLDELRRTSGIDVHEVPGADHFPAIDNPDDYYAAIGRFVSKFDEQ